MKITKFKNLVGGGRAYFCRERVPEGGVLVAVVKDDEEAAWCNNLLAVGQMFGAVPVYLFPASDHFERLSTLNRIAADPTGIVITTEEALGIKSDSPTHLKSEALVLEPDREYEFNHLIDTLAKLGYERVDFVEDRGHFARRGEILDIWPPDRDRPWRLVFAINALESLREFDVVTQRSEDFLKSGKLLPVKETAESFLSDYLPDGSLLYLDVPLKGTLPESFDRFDRLVNDPLAADAEDAGFSAFTRWGGNFKLFVEDLGQFFSQNYDIKIVCSNTGEKERVQDILFENKWEGAEPEIVIAPLQEGFFSRGEKLAVFSSLEILYKKKPVSFPKFKMGRRLEGLWEISAGDFVVHEKYGIGRYLGLRKISRGDQESEYLAIEYKGGDKLYIPPDDFRVVQKYVGLEGHRPKLYSLDTASWERAKQKAQKGAEELAAELLKLYAERKNAQGHPFPPDNHWERELADSFPYQETEDQLRAIDEVKRDLEQPRPMERLICGDVGFGKTEVAIRAAFKVVQDSRQVAVLVPTTVLAEQHFQTFTNRLSPFPVRIQMLSRFQSLKDQKQTVKDLKNGLADIVIGTHRLLSKDIQFKDLGLLIVDEEHRFGVKQKERIKKFQKDVDILLLSATPIPRTLSLSLSNLRDLSVIETPPTGRLPIETHLGLFEEKTVTRIIEAELSRGGQVFYVHNRVETILSRAMYLKKLIPDIRWGIVHGQMQAAEIEKNMWNFLHKKIDVLIATTIIESGLDIPTVNTMIVEDAENFGLAQLYQLRGRIGRERQKAYCYLFYSDEALSEEARRRLQALQEFSELGSGFRLALRDLEIRGAGNILSGRQHGFIKDIGFELYSRLIDEASHRLRGKGYAPAEEWKTTMDFSVAAFIPDEYIAAEDLRILFYRRLGSAKSQADLDAIGDELRDRFGRVPEPVLSLFKVTALRLHAERLRIKSMVEEDRTVAFFLSEQVDFSQDKLLSFVRDYGDRVEFMRGEQKGLRLKRESLAKPLFEALTDFLNDLRKYVTVKQA